MRLSLRIALLSTLTALLVLSVSGVAAAKGGPKPPPPKSNNPHIAEAQDSAQAEAAPAAAPAASGQGATTQQGGCQTADVVVTGSGNLVLNPNGATTFVCHGSLPAGDPRPARPVKFDGDECDTILTPSGRVRTICHSRP